MSMFCILNINLFPRYNGKVGWYSEWGEEVLHAFGIFIFAFFLHCVPQEERTSTYSRHHLRACVPMLGFYACGYDYT
jgi:hypothetical protein